jgi:hypothetical protein
LFILTAADEADPGSGAEVARIQAHLQAVNRALRATTTEHLTLEQREARATVLDWLDEYRSAGVFPHNHVRPGERVPVFVDPHGTPCAVGYLMLRSGEEELVEEIVRTDNLVRVHALRDDLRVARWLGAHGLTLDEAARIQPTYDGFPWDPGPIPRVSRSYRPATVGLSVATAALASYAMMSNPLAGTPWADLMTLGTAAGHSVLLANAGRSEAMEPGWAIGLNVFGLVTSVGSVASRIVRRDHAQPTATPALAVRPYVAPGPYGTEVGFVMRH